jgi:putative aldouronate transport system permease protein
MVSETANTLDFYIYQTGVLDSKYSYATALGLMQGVVALGMVLTGNWFSKKVRGSGAF